VLGRYRKWDGSPFQYSASYKVIGQSENKAMAMRLFKKIMVWLAMFFDVLDVVEMKR